jgi:hypothetical protein
MRFFASLHIPKTPVRVGFITGVYGHHTGQRCPSCGVAVHTSSFLDWCIYIGVGIWVTRTLFHL